MDFSQRIDWAYLRQQKSWLLQFIGVPEADGLVNLLDAIQDIAVDEMDIPLADVYYKEEGE